MAASKYTNGKALMQDWAFFEYMLLAEELDAEPIWVINNGISHMQDTPTSQVGPWVQVTPHPVKPPTLFAPTKGAALFWVRGCGVLPS